MEEGCWRTMNLFFVALLVVKENFGEPIVASGCCSHSLTTSKGV